MTMDPELWRMAAMVLGPGGAAWVAVKTSLNGARQDIREIKTDVGEIRKTAASNSERIATLEGGKK